MKLAVQVRLLPGDTVEDKLKWAADNGVEGVEVNAALNPPDELDRARREYENSPVPVTTVCGNTSFDFLDPDPAKRRASLEQSKQYLKFCGDVGAVGQIIPPIFGPPRIPDLSPLADPIKLEKDLLVLLLEELGDAAQAAVAFVLLEPLNRYEQHLLRRQADGVEIIERCGHPAVALISDFFHMHIEETSTPDAIRAAGKHIKHMHLADNTRMEPGTGDIDFVAAFRALKEIGFTGYMAYECGVSGPDRAASLKKSLAYLRDCMAKA